jgi:hypothetical protein
MTLHDLSTWLGQSDDRSIHIEWSGFYGEWSGFYDVRLSVGLHTYTGGSSSLETAIRLAVDDHKRRTRRDEISKKTGAGK